MWSNAKFLLGLNDISCGGMQMLWSADNTASCQSKMSARNCWMPRLIKMSARNLVQRKRSAPDFQMVSRPKMSAQNLGWPKMSTQVFQQVIRQKMSAPNFSFDQCLHHNLPDKMSAPNPFPHFFIYSDFNFALDVWRKNLGVQRTSSPTKNILICLREACRQLVSRSWRA